MGNQTKLVFTVYKYTSGVNPIRWMSMILLDIQHTKRKPGTRESTKTYLQCGVL